MTLYTYKFPFYKGSTKSIDIFDEQQVKVGSFKRFYGGIFQKTIDRVMSSDFVINVRAEDTSSELFCELKENMDWRSWLRSSWSGQSSNLGDFALIDKSKIKTEPRMEIHTSQGNKYFIYKHFGDRRTFIVNETRVTLAEISYDKLLPPQTINIDLSSQELHVLEVATMYYLFTMKY
ncbi:hypothetical protein KHA93_21370 [Bacillus sp. FJAT-49732]|uniref:Tubby C-terminal domain-containing protein n=1 Tax=Lederbergia citrisecunda TaxID=2833583 RepID=A0A942TRT5_9BACI|nr:hypothetical protein [Lederbergia citrisecunda]MBS4202163.1 hypothetical protein [Lederbergia citrisecunda]